MVKGGDELHALAAQGPGHLSHHVAARPHARGIPFIHLRVPHGESIRVLGDRTGELCPRLANKFGPLLGIEFLRAKHGDEIFVAEFRNRPIDELVKLVRALPLDVHVARIPLVVEGGDGIDPPMKVDPKLGVIEPRGVGMLGERVPRRLIGRMAREDVGRAEGRGAATPADFKRVRRVIRFFIGGDFSIGQPQFPISTRLPYACARRVSSSVRHQFSSATVQFGIGSGSI